MVRIANFLEHVRKFAQDRLEHRQERPFPDACKETYSGASLHGFRTTCLLNMLRISLKIVLTVSRHPENRS
jgi:hypothetical protein